MKNNITIGVPREIKQGEKRVGLKPSKQGVAELVKKGFPVLVEKSAGKESGFTDAEYREAGADIVSQSDLWKKSDIVIKVKEPLSQEYKFFRKYLTIFCFLHLAPNKPLTNALLKSGTTAIAYETVELEGHSTPILAAMSKIAGRMGAIEGINLLKENRGILPGPNTIVMIVGLGNAGLAAAREMINPLDESYTPNIYAVDTLPEKLENFKKLFYKHVNHKRAPTLAYSAGAVSKIIPDVDLLIGTTHAPGALQKKLVTKEMIKSMKPGSVAVDISIDQGGCFETSRPTSIAERTFVKFGVTHYCVPNIPGIVPRDSTSALTAESFPYLLKLADKGFERAVKENAALQKGVNIYKDKITHETLAKSTGTEYTPLKKLL